MHAVFNLTADAVLAVVLVVGGVIGAQVGLSVARFVRQDHARIILTVLVLLVCFQLCYTLFVEPGELFSLEVLS